MGAYEAGPLGSVEATVKYHPVGFWCLTMPPYRELGHCLVGSLTGAVASQNVTEARNGSLRPNGNRPLSANAKGSLTARPTGRAGGKPGVSDPVVPCGRAIAHQIKGTLGITG